jgi:ABC-type polysaccharide/polyol phosphate export permease
VFILNIALLNLCGFSYLFIVSLLGTRFQDVKPIITSIVQIFFLLTPVMWMPHMIPERYSFFTLFNPFYQMVTLVRQPMIGQIPDLFTYVYMLCFTLAGFLLMFLLLWRCRHRIAFWV